MQIIMLYTISDDCSWHSDIVLPIVLGSPEHAIVEFERAALTAWGEREHTFMFAGREFNVSHFVFLVAGESEPCTQLPRFLTVDEWFEQTAQNI